MTAEFLESKWASINRQSITGYRIIRISPESRTELNIGYKDNGNRCLILELPNTETFDFKGSIRQNLALDFVNENNYIVIELTDGTYFDLFNDLIVSLFQRIKEIDSVEVSAKELIAAFYKWSEFFDDKQSLGLSDEAVKGLFGELVFLRELVSEANIADINDMLECWKGPFGKGHDFVLPMADFEIKTKNVNAIDVRISSEFQLQPEYGKNLYLVVIDVDRDFADGEALSDLFQSIKNIIISKMGDTSIFLKCIAQLGLNSKNISDYDATRFRSVARVDFDTILDGFPKLTNANIPQEISNLKFDLRLNTLTDFIAYQKPY